MDDHSRSRVQGFKIRTSVFFGWIFTSLLGFSIRFRKIREEILTEYKDGFVIVCWHGQQLIGFYHFRGRGYTALASEHRDGEYAASILRYFGWRLVRGSSTRGGVGGLIKLINTLRRGIPVVITPDGPQGPIYHVEPGAIYLAQKSGVPIIPVAFVFSKAIYLKTWDKFVVPYPFCRCVVQYGEPLLIQGKLDENRLAVEKERLAQALHQTNEVAQKALTEW
ncbi:MAG TPA: lysophospholipid acyltransferase family protein [Firmicutes bacterium]|nr:lysophospholipid acyltransferase family protein [Bacillota bacterium]